MSGMGIQLAGCACLMLAELLLLSRESLVLVILHDGKTHRSMPCLLQHAKPFLDDVPNRKKTVEMMTIKTSQPACTTLLGATVLVSG